MDIKKLEKLEKLDPTAGTSALKNRWKKTSKSERLQDDKWSMQEL